MAKEILNIMNKYAKDCLSGKVPVGQQVRQAATRHFKDLERKDIYWNEEAAARALGFIQCMRHVKGTLARRKIVLEPWQKFFLGSLFGWYRKDTGARRFREGHLCISRKQGKDLSVDTLIYTPTGYKKMLDIHVGDIVFDEKGKQCNVIAETGIMHNPCYEIEFSNGEKIKCGEGHEWLTTARVNMPGVRKGREMNLGKYVPRIRTTQNIYETQYYGKRRDRNHSIAMPQPLDMPKKDLPIPPYILGLWLGNGTQGTESGINKITFNIKDDQFLSNYFGQNGIPYHRIYRPEKPGCIYYKLYPFTRKRMLHEKGFMRTHLERLNLVDNKHIPEIYLYASIEQRIELLQGLMDTDGYMDKKGNLAEFCTIYPQFKDSFCQLLSSLGVKYGITTKPCRCNGKYMGHDAYYVRFVCNKNYIQIFKFPRKLARQKEAPKTGIAARSRTVQIVKVTPIPSVPTKCIQVDSPSHMYLCGKTMIPTHNSLLLNAIGHYMLVADHEIGAEVMLAASKESQAKQVFGVALQMIHMNPEYKRFYGLQTTSETIRYPATGSFFTFIVGTPADGGNTSAGLLDEYHEAKNNLAYETIKNGQGARRQPLLVVTSTAGMDFRCDYKRYVDYCRKVVSNIIEDDTLFTLEYTLDDKDDWQDFSVWAKANPNLGISVNEEFLKSQYKKAMADLASRSSILTKHCNIWNNASTNWIDMAEWQKCYAPMKLDDFEDEPCWCGLDLASRVDLCSLIMVFQRGGEYYVFGRHYMNRERVLRPENHHFRAWEAEGALTVTEGVQTDFNYIEDDLKELGSRFKIQELAYDPREATYLMQHVRDWASFPCVEVSQSPVSFSEPMKVLEAAYKSHTIHHNNDPVINWAASNVILKNTHTKLYYPARRDENDKIDPIVAMIMAVGRAELVHKQADFSIFTLD